MNGPGQKRRIWRSATWRTAGIVSFSLAIVVNAAWPRCIGAQSVQLKEDTANAGTVAANEILGRFKTFCVKSHTIYMHENLMLRTLQERPEFEAWELKGNAADAADLIIEIRLPFLTWEWNYRMIQRTSGQLLGSGKVKALEEHQAAPLLAAEIVKTIALVRGAPQLGGHAPESRTPDKSKKWRVKGASGPLQDKDLTLSFGREFVSVTEQGGPSIQIPTHSVLSAYHIVLDGQDKSSQRRKNWDSGWDKACEKTAGGEGCLAILGAPVWLIGDAILMIPDQDQSTHFVAIRWHDDQSVNEMYFRVGALEWKSILRDLQAAGPGGRLQMSADVQQLRKEFDTAKDRALKISLASPVNVGRWPTLESGDYRLVLVERSEGQTEVFWFGAYDTRFDTPQAIAAAHFRRIEPRAETPKVTVRQRDGMNLIDTIRAEDVLLTFD